MILSQIAAMAKNRVIGKDNSLPWRIPGDMKWFKSKTNGHVLIMGRKTFESMPTPLPDRFHIIVTRNEDYQVEQDHCLVVHSLNEAIEEAQARTKEWGEEVFITGGSEIYKQSLDKADRIYLTVIDKEFEGDAYFPEFDRSLYNELDSQSHSEPIPYVIHTYERKR